MPEDQPGEGGGGVLGGAWVQVERLEFKCLKCERAGTRERAEKIKDTGTLERKRTATQPIAFIGVTFFIVRVPRFFVGIG